MSFRATVDLTEETIQDLFEFDNQTSFEDGVAFTVATIDQLASDVDLSTVVDL